MDHFESQFWNFIQVLAWVALGDRSVVSKASDSEKDYGSYLIEKRTGGKATLAEVTGTAINKLHLRVIAADFGKPSIDAAEQEILKALSKSDLTAWGLKNGEGELCVIPKEEWSVLQLHHPSDRSAFARSASSGSIEWHALKFDRDEVLAIWPDPFANGKLPQSESQRGSLPIRSFRPKRDLRAWYEDEWVKGGKNSEWLIAKGCPPEATPSEVDDLAAAREKFGSAVTRQMIRDLRRQLAPQTWRNRGRRKAQYI